MKSTANRERGGSYVSVPKEGAHRKTVEGHEKIPQINQYSPEVAMGNVSVPRVSQCLSPLWFFGQGTGLGGCVRKK